MLLLAAILFPMLAGTVISAVPNTEEGRNRLYTCAIIVTDLLGIAAFLYGKAIAPLSLTENVVLAFSLDELGRYVMLAVMLLYTAVCFYSFEYMKHEERPNVFFAFFFISYGAMLSVCMSANLVTLYLCFETLTLTSVPLVLHELTKDAVAAGLKYLFYSVAGALLGLLAVFFVYYLSNGNTTFVAGGFLNQAGIAGHEKLLLAVVMTGIVGFGTKAGLYPMHGWLPTAHPIAPAPASALLSGIVAKAGVVAIIRLVYYSVGTELIAGTWVQYVWMTLSLLTIFMGSLMAFRETVTKKRLAYSTVSQLSYILLGLSFLTQESMRGALMHLMGHVAAKGCLFLCAGVFIYKLGATRVTELKGIGKRMPVTMWCFTIASLSLVGIPPMAGFLSKWVIASAAITADMGVFSILAPVILLISALLTAGYLLTVVVHAFFPGHAEAEAETEEAVVSAEPSKLMTIPMICLCTAAVVVGIWGNTLTGFFGF
ncbi:MAG: proton-conducting transporter membrane subunit [Lachnospiraceae bacterium]|nr:proton-conducting transporter membrane subunit [Lachnospiraceae bacterium]